MIETTARRVRARSAQAPSVGVAPRERAALAELRPEYALRRTGGGAPELVDLSAERTFRQHHPELFEGPPPMEDELISEMEAAAWIADARVAAISMLEADGVDAGTEEGTSDRPTATGFDSNVNSADFVEGRALVSRVVMTAGSPDRTELQREMVEPVRAALLEEMKPVTASMRMLIETAASSHADWALYSSTARGCVGNPACGDALQRYAKLADAAFKNMLASLEMLRRPNAKAVKITVGDVANVNLGVQTMAKPQRRRRRR